MTVVDSNEVSNHGHGKLRSFLFDDQSKTAKDLTEKFLQMERLALEKYIPLLPPDMGSHCGIEHIKNVENCINLCLEKQPNLKLSSAEAYVLLGAVLFHDIGKTVPPINSYFRIGDIEDDFINTLQKRRKSSTYILKKLSYQKAQIKKSSPSDINFIARINNRIIKSPDFPHDTMDNFLNIKKKFAKNEWSSSEELEKLNRTILCELFADCLPKTAQLQENYIKKQIKNIQNKPLLRGSWLPTKNHHYNHQMLSALCVLESPEAYGIFDIGLAECIAKVSLLHDYDHKDKYYEAYKDKVYLDKYGYINIAWLGALLSLGDELDASYHRKIEIGEGSKGEFRELISGCDLDLIGRTLLIYPSIKLSEILKAGEINRLEENKKILFYVHQDILNKEFMLKQWSSELKQMDIELRACSILSENRLITIKEQKNEANTGKNEITINNFMLTVESNITPLKADKVLEAILSLSCGVFGKTDFSWKILSSEASIESIEEVRLIFHRIACLAKMPSSIINKENSIDVPFAFANQPNEVNIATYVDFEEFENKWSLCTRPSKKGINPYSLKKEIRRRFFCIFEEVKKKYEHTKTENNFTASKSRGTYLLTKNKELNYLLDDQLCSKNLGRGIFLPDFYDDDSQKKRRLGMNIVISGPPGIGKTTLAAEIISSIAPVMCKKNGGSDAACEKLTSDAHECSAMKKACVNGLTAYISIEQPLITIQSVFKKFHNSSHINELGKRDIKLEIKNIQNMFTSNCSETYDGYMNRGYRESYRNLTAEAEKNRVVMLTKLSPRFDTQLPAAEQSDVFWSRFKQISRLCENSPWYNDDWLEPNKAKSPPPLLGLVIDSLNAFGQQKMNREQIFQLFRLITWSGVLGVFIYEENERHQVEGNAFFDEVDFLSDIFIRLAWSKHEYSYKQITIEKSRYQKHVLGPHPYKIKTDTFKIYPSLHTLIAREQVLHKTSKNEKKGPRGFFQLSDDSFSLLKGNRNTHKLGISMLYAFNSITSKVKNNSVLLVNFGPDIDPDTLNPGEHIQNIEPDKKNKSPDKTDAIGDKLKAFKKLKLDEVDKPESKETSKYSFKTFACGENAINKLFILSFYTGFLMPEECVSKILEKLEKNPKIKGIIFFSAYHLPMRFPLLAEDQKFIPYLIRILKLRRKGLLLACLDSDSMQSEETKKFISALESTADNIITASPVDNSSATGIKGNAKVDTADYKEIELVLRRIVARDYTAEKYKLTFERSDTKG